MIARGAAAEEREAARELQAYLKQITGADFPISDDGEDRVPQVCA